MAERLNKSFAFGIYAYALFIPFSISGAQAALGFLLLLWIIYFLVNRKFEYKFRIIDPIIALFLLWVFISAIFSVHPDVTFYKLRRYWIYLGYFALARGFLNEKVTLKALKIMTLSAGVVAIYGIAQHIWGNSVPRYLAPKVDLYQKTGDYFHAVGLFDHHLTYGNSLLLILITGLGLIFYLGWQRQTALYVPAVLLGICALVFSFARSAWIGFSASIFVFGYQLGKRVLIPIVFAFGLIVIAGALFSPSVRFRLEKTVSVAHNLERVATWTTTIDMIRDYPLFGIGIGSYRRLAPEYRQGYNIHWTAKSHAHNSYLQVCVESGVIALVLFLLWLVILIVKSSILAIKAKNNGARALLYSLTAAHIGFAVSSIFQHNLGDGEVAMTWFFLIAVTFSLGDSFGKKKEDILFEHNSDKEAD